MRGLKKVAAIRLSLPGQSRLLLILFFMGIITGLQAQKKNDSVPRNVPCQPRDIQEVLFRKSQKPSDTTRKFNFFLLPYLAYSPTKGFQLGGGGTFTWYVGKSHVTNQSAASAGVEFTTNEQQLYQFKSNIYADKNRWFLQGDWRYYSYNIPSYGLGSGKTYPFPPYPDQPHDSTGAPEWDQAYPVKFQWLRIHEIVSYRFTKNLYAGLGYHLDYHYKINDKYLRTDSADYYMTPHYVYSKLHAFDPKHYIASGLSLNFVYDTRDNLINPYKGYYVTVNYRVNQKWLGSSKDGSQLWAEFRTYVGLEKKLPRHLLAFWLYGGFQLSGQIPYFDLWATGFDQMNSSGRGFLQGRWRGENLVYGEMEYRFPISRCSQVLGGVVFLNLSTASAKDQGIRLFSFVRPAGGAGIRIMVSKQNRTNILIDFTLGQDMAPGVYFSAQEAF